MKTKVVIGSAILCCAASALAQSTDSRAPENLVQTVKLGCSQEIRTHCADVTPGEGRVLACLYSHEDKLSGRCEYALYDASAQLQRAVAALSFLSSECDADLKQYCAEVPPGQGRILQCLKQHEEKLTQRCQTALQDVGEE